MCVCVCVCACAHVRVRVCVCVCVFVFVAREEGVHEDGEKNGRGQAMDRVSGRDRHRKRKDEM